MKKNNKNFFPISRTVKRSYIGKKRMISIKINPVVSFEVPIAEYTEP